MGARVGYNRIGRRTDADACSLTHRRGYRMEVMPEVLGRFSEQREPPRKPAHTKAMELGKKKQREQHFVLSTREIPSSSLSLSFYRSRREPFGH